jgi:hypothetical protein
MGTNPHIDPWNYLFHAQLHQGSNTEVTTLGNVDMFVRSGPGVDPYFHLPMSDPPVRVAESMVLSEERRRCATPHVHG